LTDYFWQAHPFTPVLERSQGAIGIAKMGSITGTAQSTIETVPEKIDSPIKLN
jgi:hypothetical protein